MSLVDVEMVLVGSGVGMGVGCGVVGIELVALGAAAGVPLRGSTDAQPDKSRATIAAE
jgi:hypothetical protein